MRRLRWTRRDIAILALVAALVLVVTVATLIAAQVTLDLRAAQLRP